MRNHWIQEKRKRDQSTKYSVQFYCYDPFGIKQSLSCLMPLINNKIEWEPGYKVQVDGVEIYDANGKITYVEDFRVPIILYVGSILRLNYNWMMGLP